MSMGNKPWVLGLLIGLVPCVGFASKPQVKDCQRIQFQIGQYQQQQRQASGAESDKLRQLIRSAKSEFELKQCYRFKSFLN